MLIDVVVVFFRNCDLFKINQSYCFNLSKCFVDVDQCLYVCVECDVITDAIICIFECPPCFHQADTESGLEPYLSWLGLGKKDFVVTDKNMTG